MLDDPRLLIVDDEETICRGCKRIFTRQGFKVETSRDPREGLALAERGDYAAVLLDVKMPAMDGLEFLELLRQRNADVPVILITAHPSVAGVASAMRLGASDYVSKPFTPGEIVNAVRRTLSRKGEKPTAAAEPPSPAIEPWSAADPFRFLDETWLQAGSDGTVRVGAVVGPASGARIKGVRLPAVGSTVYQGLPLAEVTFSDSAPYRMPSPISGRVIEVNTELEGRPALLSSDPCGRGWIARISPAWGEKEARHCRPRHLILANADPASAPDQARRLTSLGCQVRIAEDPRTLQAVIRAERSDVLVLDAASFGEHGPELAGTINAECPSVRIIVIASPNAEYEAAYRTHRIFYYAVAPFDDNEILDLLNAVFTARRPPLPRDHREGGSQPISRIRITDRRGERVCLLAARGLMLDNSGLGWLVRRKLLDGPYPIETTLGTISVTPRQILDTARTCDRLWVLMPKDMGRLPGTLICDTSGEFFSVPGNDARKVTALVVQPEVPSSSGRMEFDDRTAIALAEHVVREMVSC